MKDIKAAVDRLPSMTVSLTGSFSYIGKVIVVYQEGFAHLFRQRSIIRTRKRVTPSKSLTFRR